MNQKKYMNPYLAGFLLGLVLLGTIYVTGRGLGASGAVKSVVLSTIENIAPQHSANTPFIKTYSEAHPGGPFKDWLVLEVIGVVMGAFFFQD